MPRKKRHREKEESRKPAEPKSVFTSPFKDLKKMLAGREIVAPKPVPAPPPKVATPPPPEPESDSDLFMRAVEGARKIASARPEKLARELRIDRKIVSEEAEVIARLSDL